MSADDVEGKKVDRVGAGATGEATRIEGQPVF